MKRGKFLIEKLYDIFPDSLYNPNFIPSTKDYYLVSKNQDQLFIPLKSLKPEALSLLELLTLSQSKEPNLPTGLKSVSSWKEILKGDQSVDDKKIKSIRLLHLHIKKKDPNFDLEMWYETLVSTSPAIIEILEWQANYFIVILDNNQLIEETLEQTEGILTTLDDDFSLTTSTLVGQPFNPHNRLPFYFNTENAVFEWAVKEDFLNRWTYVSETLLKQIGHSALKNISTLRYYKQLISGQDDLDLIKSLFENNGNLSQSAEALFIHRNTLTYRMDKFSKKTGLNLSKLSDLMLAYLLVMSGK